MQWVYTIIFMAMLTSCGQPLAKRHRSQHCYVTAEVSAEFLRRGAKAKFSAYEWELMERCDSLENLKYID